MSHDRATSECPRCEAPVFLGTDHEMIDGEPAHRICAAKHREDEAKPRPIGALAIVRAKTMLRGIFPDAVLVDEPSIERSTRGRRMLDESHECTTEPKS